MYLLDADDAAIPALRAGAGRPGRLPRRRRRRRAVERPRPRRRRRRRDRGRHRGRAPAPDPGHPLRRAGRRSAGQDARTRTRPARSSPWPPGRVWRRSSRRPGAVVVARRPGPAALDRRCCSRRSRRAGPPRSSCCPTTPTRCASPRSRPARPRQDHDVRVAVIPTHAQVQGLAALAVHEPGRAFDQDVLRDDRDRPPRPARRGHGRGAAGDDDGRPVRARRRARRDRRRLRGRRVTTSTRSPRDVLDRLLGGGGELVTLVGGADDGELAARVRGLRRGAHPACRRRGVRRWAGALPAAGVASSEPEEARS